MKFKTLEELSDSAKESLSAIEVEGFDYAINNGYVDPDEFLDDEESKSEYWEAKKKISEFETYIADLLEKVSSED